MIKDNLTTHANDEELVKLAKDLHKYSIKALTDLRQAHPINDMPADVQPHQKFLKDIISTTAVFLTETLNWYNQDQQKDTPDQREELNPTRLKE